MPSIQQYPSAQRRVIRCGHCRQQGHNRIKCPHVVPTPTMTTRSMTTNTIRPITNSRQRRAIKCGLCREEGHNRRACPSILGLENELLNRIIHLSDSFREDQYTRNTGNIRNTRSSLCKIVKQKKILVRIVDEGKDDIISASTECDVCMENVNKKRWIKFGCGHGMCRTCTSMHLQTKHTCHMCRAPVQTIDMIKPFMTEC